MKPSVSVHEVNVGESTVEITTGGQGSPTVLFLNGMGTSRAEWALVLPEVARRTSVLSYDRNPAVGWRAAPRGPGQLAAELSELLDQQKLSGPFVLVGHSWGGMILRAFAAQRPQDVAGVVYVDCTSRASLAMLNSRWYYLSYFLMLQSARLPSVRRALLSGMHSDRLSGGDRTAFNTMLGRANRWTAWSEIRGVASTDVDLGDALDALPEVPSRVLLGGHVPRGMSRGMRQHLEGWAETVKGRDDLAVTTLPDCGHFVSLERPDAVITAISEVLDIVQQTATDQTVKA